MKKHRLSDASEFHGRDGGEPRERGGLVLILLCSIKPRFFEGPKARNKASTPPHRTENRYTDLIVQKRLESLLEFDNHVNQVVHDLLVVFLVAEIELRRIDHDSRGLLAVEPVLDDDGLLRDLVAAHDVAAVSPDGLLRGHIHQSQAQDFAKLIKSWNSDSL